MVDAMEKVSEDPVELGLWERLRSQGDADARHCLIARHLEFARIMAAKLYAKRYGDECEFGDFLQFATIGLIESVDRYDPANAASFRTYAAARIRGAVLDGLERMSEQQQQINARRRLHADRIASLAAGRDDIFEQLAQIAIGLACGYMLEGSSLYQDEESAVEDNSYSRVELRQLSQRLLSLIEQLAPPEAMVIRAHYLNQLPFGDIAQMMHLSNGRVSQLHRAGLEHLREAFSRLRKCDMIW